MTVFLTRESRAWVSKWVKKRWGQEKSGQEKVRFTWRLPVCNETKRKWLPSDTSFIPEFLPRSDIPMMYCCIYIDPQYSKSYPPVEFGETWVRGPSLNNIWTLHKLGHTLSIESAGWDRVGEISWYRRLGCERGCIVHLPMIHDLKL